MMLLAACAEAGALGWRSVRSVLQNCGWDSFSRFREASRNGMDERSSSRTQRIVRGSEKKVARYVR